MTSGMLSKAGGSFTLTADVNFGATYGLKAKHFTSASTNPASAGVLRIASTDSISWRNNANDNDKSLAKDTSDQLTYAGTAFLSSAGALLSSAIPALTGDVTKPAGSAVTTLAATSNGTLTNLSALTTAAALASVGTITSGTWHGTAIAYSYLALTGAILNADLAGSIAASKLVGTDIATVGTITSGTWSGTAIAASKGGTGISTSASTGLAKVSSGTWSVATLVNADVSASAAIDFSKLAALTSANILVGNVSNVAASVAVSGDLTMLNTGAFTVAKIQTTTVSGTTGTTNVVFSASPTITGTLAAAAGTYSSTLTVTGAGRFNGKLGVGMAPSNDLDVTGTFGATGAATLGSTLDVTGLFTSTNTTDSSSSTTGAIKTAGGLGVAKAAYIGTTLNVAGAATFNAAGTALAISASNSGASESLTITNTSATAVSAAQLRLVNDASRGFRFQYYSSGSSAAPLTNGPTGEQGAIFTDGAKPLVLGTNVAAALTIDTSQNLSVPNGTTLGSTSTNSANYPLTVRGNSTAGQSLGPYIRAGTNASDYSLTVTNSANSANYFVVVGDGTVVTKNNTLDNGSGNATFAGTLSAAGTVSTTSGPVSTGQGGTAGNAQYIKNGAGNTTINSVSTSSGNTAAYSITSGAGGLMIVYDASDGYIGLFLVAGNSVTIVSDPASKYSVAAGTNSKINVTASAGTVSVQNFLGANKQFAVWFLTQ